MERKNEYSWTILIGSFAQHGKAREALVIFAQFVREGIEPDKVTCLTILSICASQGALLEGQSVYELIICNGLEHDVTLNNALVNMYSKCDRLQDVHRLFQKMSKRNIVSWNGMLTAYTQHTKGIDALRIYNTIHLQGVTPNIITFIEALSACASEGELGQGRMIHASILDKGYEHIDNMGNTLINMYGKCNSLEDAFVVFEKMLPGTVVSWNSIMGACLLHDQSGAVLSLFCQMHIHNVSPDRVTFLTLLDACAMNMLLVEGKLVHICLIDSGLFDMVVMTALIGMYTKCGSLGDAFNLFTAMHTMDVVVWNVIILGYTQNSRNEEAYKLYQQMKLEGVGPDAFTYASVLDACTKQMWVDEGKHVLTSVFSSGLECSAVLDTALLNFYGKCGNLEVASKIFNGMSVKDIAAWNTLIAAYVNQGNSWQALSFFKNMQANNAIPDLGTFLCLLDACRCMVSLEDGREVHELVIESGFEVDSSVGTSLIAMYGECGSLDDALVMFNKLCDPTVVTWTAIIKICTQHGQGRKAVQVFDQMKEQGVTPNGTTFLNVLSTCSHSGFVKEGMRYFNSMTGEYGLKPSLEHCNCVVDLFARAGYLQEAEDWIHSMPSEPNATSWITLLSACQCYADVERGEHVAENALQLAPDSAVTYVLLSNLYAAAGRWDDATKIRKTMDLNGVKKQPGCSSITIDKCIHKFFAGGSSHPQKKQILAELEKLSAMMKIEGYVPNTQVVLRNVTEEEKEARLLTHSEKLAIAYGLMSTHSGTPLFIIKNLRICADCCSAAKFISKISHREITIRDINCFHRFKDGISL